MTKELYHGEPLEYWKENAVGNYPIAPISVLKYLTILELHTSHLTTEVTLLREALEVETKTTKRLTRGINLCLAAINGGLDGLELDNTCDVTENSFIIQQLKDQSEILTQALTPEK
jgi:hypothetical protein